MPGMMTRARQCRLVLPPVNTLSSVGATVRRIPIFLRAREYQDSRLSLFTKG
jgi:hypothetical protein